jgi:omega-6 fatty acid desaturase (delta-12 desaturase)
MDEARLRAELRAFVTPSAARGLFSVFADVTVYLAAVALAMIVEATWARLAFAILAGMMIAALFVLAHDAAHNSLTPLPWVNRLLAYFCMFPALHNPTLWRIEHNHFHHQAPNVKGLNSWSPVSYAEFQAMSPWRRRLERLYRSGLASGPYYLVERWWRAKLFPRAAAQLAPAVHGAAVRDLILLLAWFVLFAVALVLAAERNANPSPGLALTYGFAVPFAVWNVMMGYTVYFQHTHPQVPWFRTRDEADAFGGQHQRTVTILHSRIWGLLTHEIMEHNAHHVHPLIPHYRLRAAQRRLGELAEPTFLAERLTPAYIADVNRRCKLYDYERHCWLDFDGRPTSAPCATVPQSTAA